MLQPAGLASLLLALVVGASGCSEASRCAGVTCAAQDQCHEDGVCDRATGRCSRPEKAEGTPCNDGSSLTFYDACRAGICVGVPAATPAITGTTPASPSDASATPVFAGTAQETPAGVTSRAQLYQDDECHRAVAEASAPVSGGRFSIALPTVSAVALNTASAFTVRVTDSASNTSRCSAPFTYVYAKPGATPVAVGVSQVIQIQIPEGPAARGAAERAAGPGAEKAQGGQRQRTIEARVVEVRVPRVAERPRAEPAAPRPAAPAPAPEVREPPPARPPDPALTPAPAPAAAVVAARPPAPVVEDAPAYATAGFRKPTTTEPGCVPSTVRVTPQMLRGITGPVVVKFAVGRDGVPSRFEVLSTIEDPRLGSAIQQAVEACEWTTGADTQGRPTSAWVIMPLRFKAE